jgi:hypothetical protein
VNTTTKSEIHRWRAFAVLAVCFFMTIVAMPALEVGGVS